ncbi:MAG: 50S ribosomal protein L11 methyltransferase [Alphaproteobacteria bacterium]
MTKMPTSFKPLQRLMINLPAGCDPSMLVQALSEEAVAVSAMEINAAARPPMGIEDEEIDWLNYPTEIEALFTKKPADQWLLPLLFLLEASTGHAPLHVEWFELPMTDWLQQVYTGFPRLKIGRFVIYGSHHAIPSMGTGLPLKVDAGMAFGSGEHPTTRGCLMALEKLAKFYRPQSGYDAGCGSGVLAMAMVRLWHIPVLGVDIDPQSALVTKTNARINQLSPFIKADAGDASTKMGRQRFDIITANILARPLVKMAPKLAAALNPNGYIIVSGLLSMQRAAICHAYRTQGLQLAGEIVNGENINGEWPTLIFCNTQSR